MADWSTIASLATAGGTLVLAVATYASVQSAKRSARASERALSAAIRPLLVNTRFQDPMEKVGFADQRWLKVEGGRGAVEFANQQQATGKNRMQAVIEAASLRLRPILMTTGAMVLGALPLALASGAGAESRQQIGWVIVGGMSLGTLLTLFVIPMVYTVLGARHRPEEGTVAAAPQPAE